MPSGFLAGSSEPPTLDPASLGDSLPTGTVTTPGDFRKPPVSKAQVIGPLVTLRQRVILVG